MGCVITPAIRRFINYFGGTRCIIAGSFRKATFSIVFGGGVFIRFGGGDKEGVHSRNLLGDLKVSHRVISKGYQRARVG